MTSINRAPGIIIVCFLMINNILFVHGSILNNQVENDDFYSNDDEGKKNMFYGKISDYCIFL